MSIRTTIIIPIYKEEKYIEECLNSVFDEIKRSNTPNDQYEIIVVSDGATEELASIVCKYETIFANFKFLKMEHKGAGAARNLGIKVASGEYVAFIDADDRMSVGFLKPCNELLEKNRDLYIFGIKRIEDGKEEDWTVKDKNYNSIAEFADEYIRKGHLLIYSNCNKLYKTKIIKENNIGFNEEIHFGEDRLFNYDYIRYCNNIITSSIIKHDYLKRNKISQSTKHYDNYFNIALNLHKEKVKCFIDLSKSVSEDEIKKFVAEDLIKELEKTFERFSLYKDEEEENIKDINDFVFENSDEMSDEIGIFIILGSRNCGYKIEKVIELCKDRPYMNYIVSGGNIHISGNMTEAEFMAKMLEDNGIVKENIYIDNIAINTEENLEYSYEIAKKILDEKDLQAHRKIGILSSGFHLKRVKLVTKRYCSNHMNDTFFFSAYGPTVSLNNWYKTTNGRNLVYYEIRKNIRSDFEIFKKSIYKI